ncbi:MAG: pyrroloquinoline quinone-dependent dehydrogenase, partial [Flavobacteriia bacterium]
MKRLLLFLWVAVLASCSNEKTTSSDKDYFTTWEHYLGDPERTHYANLDQIDTANVGQLKLAWSYKSGGLQEGRTTQIQTSPLIIGNMLYGVNAAIELFAIDASTGKEIWKFKPSTKDESGLGLNRGLNYWKSNGDEPSRIFFSSGPRLYAIDIETGKPFY